MRQRNHRWNLLNACKNHHEGEETQSVFLPVAVSVPRAVFGYVAVALGCSLIFAGVLETSAPIPRPILFLGKISYGLYVFRAWGLNGANFLLRHTHLPGRLLLKDMLAFVFPKGFLPCPLPAACSNISRPRRW